jgi:DNA mismatch endonuclease (patch repair protein)
MGLRYFVHRRVLSEVQRRADIVFVRARVTVFVDGCFWHSCPKHKTAPKSNADWWAEKLSANTLRDADTDRRLARQGWHVERIWEHEEVVIAAARIAQVVRKRYNRLHI